jgi:hypothetical protein
LALATALVAGGCGSSSSGQASATAKLPPPRFGHSLNIGLVSGTVFVTLPNHSSFRLGVQDRSIPIGSLLDTTRGRVDLRAATPPASGKRAPLQDAQFFQGQFTVRQTNRTQATQINLAGGRFAKCPPPSAGTPAPKPGSATNPAVRLLRASGTGTFSTQGRYAAATVRGTIWTTEDFCDGTLVQVTRGIVSVEDLSTHKTVMITAGHSFFVRAP